MDLKVANMIQLCLSDEVVYNMMDEETTTGLWSKLEMLHITKSLSNKLYFEETTIWDTHEGRDSCVGAFKLL